MTIEMPEMKCSLPLLLQKNHFQGGNCILKGASCHDQEFFRAWWMVMSSFEVSDK